MYMYIHIFLTHVMHIISASRSPRLKVGLIYCTRCIVALQHVAAAFYTAPLSLTIPHSLVFNPSPYRPNPNPNSIT